MRNIGIMGGTFNPIHMGHLIIAEKAREQFCLDEVIFLPSGIPYMKNEKEVLAGHIRTEMTRLAIDDNPFFKVSTIEIEKAGPTYTYETLLTLRDNNPNTNFYFIMGADSLWSIGKWKNPDQVFANCHVLAAVRGGRSMTELEIQAGHLTHRFGAEISLLQTSHIEISSSMIRRLVKEGKSIRYLVPETVYDYIIIHKLYKEEN